ncbi:ABC transporter substrate-binding protein [Phytohabitans sp. ZYX-F-186]|uniref:ABC transporter substrate-binding protein n=1 Tax=Phytohabitans maris TaxID=3071409 RepID=A0ABU0ZWE6_9ACTN|nr:ABC transporter substrate-binding protein [Phytohabitans sp. ZYX-F-186]MDQ7911121.1 ABC transporter substrate-binding protein [Phytohabitans sp. ZYX-F-186]
MSTRRRSLLAATVAAALTLGIGACGGDDADTAETGAGGRTKIRLATTNPTVTLLAIYAAQEQGYFTRHGLDVEVTPIADATQIPSAIGKQFDVGWTVQPIGINAAARGIPITVVAGGERNQPNNQQLFLLSGAGSKIKSVKDLAGARVGTATLAGANTMLTKAVIDKAGVDLKSVQFVQVAFADMPDQLRAGTVDVIAVSPPHAQIALDAGAQDLGVWPYQILGDTALTTFMMAGKEWAAAHQDALGSMRQALDEGGKWIGANQDGAAELLKKRTGLDAALVDRLKLQLPSFTYQEYDADDFVPWVELMKTYGTLDKGTDAKQLVDKMLGTN